MYNLKIPLYYKCILKFFINLLKNPAHPELDFSFLIPSSSHQEDKLYYSSFNLYKPARLVTKRRATPKANRGFEDSCPVFGSLATWDVFALEVPPAFAGLVRNWPSPCLVDVCGSTEVGTCPRFDNSSVDVVWSDLWVLPWLVRLVWSTVIVDSRVVEVEASDCLLA